MSHETQATSAQSAPLSHAHFAFGITLDQIDALDRTIATLIAVSDVMSLGRSVLLDEKTLPTLGGVMYEAARTARSLVDQVGEQRLESKPHRSPPPASESHDSQPHASRG
ncbi:hypothetical protein [Xanthomonas massiliensis]|uniref:hypothetical protein n=1 Tax=Xanthomonas massiliensis TaxID=1720302 RepID=UPI000A7ADA88|nr:hypothetical protein [Xanthomonas massiliensis]